MQIKLRTTAHGDFSQQRSVNWNGRPLATSIFAASTHNADHTPNMANTTARLGPAQSGYPGHLCIWGLESTTGGADS